jgi:hypothetical protein
MLAPLHADQDLVRIEHHVARDHGEDFLAQLHQEVGLAAQAPLMREQNLQPLPRDRGRGLPPAEKPQHTHAALRPNSRFISPLRSVGTSISTCSPSSLRMASR